DPAADATAGLPNRAKTFRAESPMVFWRPAVGVTAGSETRAERGNYGGGRETRAKRGDLYGEIDDDAQ
ncbi:MAG TPA: hypothetical protein VG713_07885, partial [Pirellulales bacterium]|nr:hypothetical protein [Pirellulales bacterium]